MYRHATRVGECESPKCQRGGIGGDQGSQARFAHRLVTTGIPLQQAPGHHQLVITIRVWQRQIMRRAWRRVVAAQQNGERHEER